MKAPQLVVVVLFLSFLHATECVNLKGYLPPAEAPLKQIWLNQNVPGYPTVTPPILPPSSKTNENGDDVALFWSLIYQTDTQEQLSGISLRDGKVLWTQIGLNANISNQTYTLPYVGVGGFLPKHKAAIVNYQLTTLTFIAQGSALLDLLTGEPMQSYYTEPFEDTWLVALTVEDAVYYVKNKKNVATLFRLEGPDFDPSAPAANRTFATNAQAFSNAPPLLIGQEHGVLIYMLNNQSAATGSNTQTYYLLEHLYLNVTWATPTLPGSSSFAFIEPKERQFVLSSYSVEKPYVTQLQGFAIGQADPIEWNFETEWFTSVYVPIIFAGTVMSPDGSQTRACAGYTIWSDNTGQHSNGSFFCFDVATLKVTFNTTLKDKNTKATFMTMYNNWIVMLDNKSGDLLALDGFAEDPWANPTWRIPNQHNLVSLTWSSDYSYLLATYQNPTALARWDVVA